MQTTKSVRRRPNASDAIPPIKSPYKTSTKIYILAPITQIAFWTNIKMLQYFTDKS